MVERSCWQALLAVVMGAPLVVGCGSSSELVPVEGIVTLDGNPLPDAQVLFYQPDSGPETNFTDITDAGGRFTLTTLNNEETGVKPGKYVVNLRTGFAGPDLIETDPIPKELVPPKYQELEYEVPPEGDTEVKFELKSK